MKLFKKINIPHFCYKFIIADLTVANESPTSFGLIDFSILCIEDVLVDKDNRDISKAGRALFAFSIDYSRLLGINQIAISIFWRNFILYEL
tara:strand:+ start:602 stop:874 length:273 start_codon:yes stop_codon:yes gene_type:complete